MLVFDIETAPLPDCDLKRAFDGSEIKLGNLKDPEKIKEKLDNAWFEFKSKAALSASTGYVLCIGYYYTDRDQAVIDDGENDDGDTREAKILRGFWSMVETCRKNSIEMGGVNIHDFDLPFLVRRSWILGVDVPAGVLGQGRYWHSVFVDLRKVWLCGQSPNGVKSSFDELAAAFGTGGKPAGINGGDFAELWERDRPTAIAYLENDLKQPAKWAKAMGVC